MRTNKIINYHDITSNSHKQQTRKGVVTSYSFKRICPQITVVTCLPMKALIKDSPFRQQDLGEMTFHLHGVCLSVKRYRFDTVLLFVLQSVSHQQVVYRITV